MAALVARRDQLKELVALEARREEHHEHPAVKKEAALLAKQLAAHLAKIEAEIDGPARRQRRGQRRGSSG